MKFITVIKKEKIRSDLIIVHSCCAHFQKRILFTIHNKFSKYSKSKCFILECMGILIQCDTYILDDLDYCYEKFITILLTSCSKDMTVLLTSTNFTLLSINIIIMYAR